MNFITNFKNIKLKKKLTTSFILFLSINYLSAQTGDAFITNLNTPDYGMIVSDITYSSALNQVYVYSPKKILAFEGNNANNKTTINFGGNDEEYGQYQYPFNAFTDITTLNMMATDENNHFIYIVTPKLNLIRVNTVTNQKDNNFFIPSPYGNNLLGDNIIQFDNTHNRLYWACRIKNQTGQNGFYLGVYQANGNNLTLIDSFTDFYSTSDPAYQIFDIAFNQTNNIFYLSRNGSYEVWEISGNNLVLRKTVSIGIYNQTGKILYKKNGNFHKVFCLPYGDDAPATVYIIDGDNYNSVTQLSVAYNKVKTAAYDINNNNLLVGYIQDETSGCPSYDIQIYHNNGSSYNSIQTIATGTPATNNSPLWFVEKTNNNFLLGKNDEIVLLSPKNDNSYTYNAQTIIFAKTNYFNKGVVTNNNQTYFIKATNSGVESINSDNTLCSQVVTGSITYNSVFSKSLQKAWFFTRQHIDNSHLLVVNTATNSTDYITLNKPVGDVIFNPYNNQFIVIENKNSSTKFKVYNGFTNALVGEYQTGLSNCEKMFIDPNNNLYITGNMLPTNNTIIIKVFNATDYSYVNSLIFNYSSTSNKGYVKADFDYNYHNKSVYGVFSTFYAGFAPLAQRPVNNDGVLIKISSNFTTTSYTNGIELPIKIICDNDINTVNSYNIDASKLGECYILTHDGKLKVFDCDNESITSIYNCSDFTYDPYSNTIYTINGGTFGKIYKIDENSTQTQIYSSTSLSSCRSINYNPYNSRLYSYVVKNDSTPQTMLYSLNPNDVASGLQNTYLHNKSLDILGDNDFYFPNKPVFAPVSNHVLIPNGTHGNISVVSFQANEPLPLKPYNRENNESFTWLSFPRLISTNPPVNTVLGGDNIVPNDYEQQSQLENLPLAAPTNTGIVTNVYNGNQWPASSQGFTSVNSIYGYKLSLKYNSNPQQDIRLFLQGNVLPSSTTVNLKDKPKENWIGYWLYQEQSPFDAISSGVLDKLTEIKAQDWFCYKDWSMGQQYPHWICGSGIGKAQPHLKYGDMVILKSNSEINNFQWQNGSPFGAFDIKSATEYFQFNEEEDYTAYLVEIDTTNPPAEIGAFIGNTCIGASKVLTNDTIVLIRGYDKDTTGTVYFVEYFNSQKSGNPVIKNYFVKNTLNIGWQKRSINTAERKSHYLISFATKNNIKVNDIVIENPLLRVYPNPANNSVTVKYATTGHNTTGLALYDVTGKKVFEQSFEQPEGMHQYKINTEKLKNGIYLLHLTTGKISGTKQIVVNK